MSFDKKEYQREYMKKRRERAKGHAEKMGQEQPTGELLPDGRPKYAGREYREDGSLVLFEQRCGEEGCKGLWSASIAIPCPYCGGSGKRKYA